MTTFAIDSDNNITAYATPEQVPEGHVRFSGERELAKVSAEWPASHLVEIWNSLPGVTPVKKFTDRKTAVIRIVKAIQSLEPTPAPASPVAPAPEPEPAPQESAAPVESAAPEAAAPPEASTSGPAKPAAAREGSKKAQVVTMLRQPQGATLKEIMTATGWQAHSVRGFISGSLVKKSGLKVESYKRSDGERAYIAQ